METKTLARQSRIPTLFEDVFRSFSPFSVFSSLLDDGGRVLSVPAANITENKDSYQISLAAPGMKRDDFKIDLDGNQLRVSAETEEQTADQNERFSRQEYNFTSFTRSFILPEEVNRERVEARYENGELMLILPKKEEVVRASTPKSIQVQ